MVLNSVQLHKGKIRQGKQELEEQVGKGITTSIDPHSY